MNETIKVKDAGIFVIASASTEAKCDVLRDLGADVVFNYKEVDEKDEILKATDGRGVDIIYDQIAGKGLAAKFEFLADFGQIILYNWLEGDPELDQLQRIVKGSLKAHSIRSFSFHVFDDKPERRRANADKCFEMIKEGRIKPLVYKEFPLEEARAAHELLDRGEAIGKIIMKP